MSTHEPKNDSKLTLVAVPLFDPAESELKPIGFCLV